MFKYTYIIEYNIICNDNREIKIIRYSSDYELTSFVVNRETIANTTRSRAQFFIFFLMVKFCTINFFMNVLILILTFN